MSRGKFLKELEVALKKHLTEEEVRDAILYYDELIKDRLENQESEKTVIDSLGSIDSIVQNITMESLEKRPAPKNVKGVLDVFHTLLHIAKTPVAILISIVFIALLFAFGVTVFSLVVSGFAAGVAILASLFDAMVVLALEGSSWMEYLFLGSVHLMLLGFILVLFGFIYKVSFFCLKKITQLYTKVVKRRVVKQHVGETI